MAAKRRPQAPDNAPQSQRGVRPTHSLPKEELPKRESIRRAKSAGLESRARSRTAEGGNPKAERAGEEAPDEPYNDPRLSQRDRQAQAREGRIDNLRRDVMHNLSYCHIQSLPPGFESQDSIKICVDWHNTLDGPAAYTKLQTFTQT